MYHTVKISSRIWEDLFICYLSITVLTEILVLFLNPDIYHWISYCGIILTLMIGIICFLLSIKDNSFHKIIVPVFAWLNILLFSWVISPALEPLLLKGIYYTIIHVFLTGFILYHIDNFVSLGKKINILILISLVYCAFYIIRTFHSNPSYNMNFSYTLLVPTSYCMLYGIHKKNWIYFVLSMLFVALNLRFGSRGIFLCLLSSIIISFYFKLNQRNIVKLIFLLFGIIIFVLFLYNYRESLMRLLLQQFPNSRTIQLLSSGNLFYLSGREKYYSFCLSEFFNSPLRIRGLFSDRIALAEYFHREGVDAIWGSYSHNLFIEILFQFGIWGLMIIIFCMISFLRICNTIRKYGNCDEKIFASIFIGYALGQLLVSSSYLIAPSFGLMLGGIYALNKNLRQDNIKKII